MKTGGAAFYYPLQPFAGANTGFQSGEEFVAAQ